MINRTVKMNIKSKRKSHLATTKSYLARMCVPAMTLKPALGVDKAVGRYAAAEVEGRSTGMDSCMEKMT